MRGSANRDKVEGETLRRGVAVFVPGGLGERPGRLGVISAREEAECRVLIFTASASVRGERRIPLAALLPLRHLGASLLAAGRGVRAVHVVAEDVERDVVAVKDARGTTVVPRTRVFSCLALADALEAAFARISEAID